jgi:Uma2 family endonuclease
MTAELSRLIWQSDAYPTTDHRPMGETDLHRSLMINIIEILQDRYAADPAVYVTGNLLVFYVKGDKHRHLSPDVMVVRGVPKRQRDNYLIWEEGKSPDFVLEVTSSSTSNEDRNYKFELYEQKLKVKELFLFDPRSEYLDPPLQGYRLRRGKYVAIPRVKGRIPSSVLGLHLEAAKKNLLLFDPTVQAILPTRSEALAAANQSVALAERRAKQAEAELRRLRSETEERRKPAND